MSGRARRNGSIPALWRHSRNYRRFGYIILTFAFLLLLLHYDKPATQTAAAGNPQTTTAHYQPPAAVPPVARAAPLPAATHIASAATLTAMPPPTGTATTAAAAGNNAAQPPKALVAPELGELAKYRPLHDSWGERLNPDGTIPADGFDAYYIDTNEPSRVHFRSHSSYPATWGGSSGQGLPSERLGIYWVGQLHVPKTARYQFALHQTERGRVRISIDHRIIKEGEGTAMPEIELRQGVHIVEVEYLNNHADGYTFYLALQKKTPVYSVDNLATALKALHLPANTVAYVATTRRAKSDRSAELFIKDDSRPYILILPTGWRAWNIHTGNNPPRAIVRYQEAGDVWVEGGDPPVLLWQQFISMDKLRDGEPDCYCAAESRTLQCGNNGNDDLGLFAENIRRWTGYPLAGISFGAQDTRTTVPEISVTPATIMTNRRQLKEKTADMRRACSLVRSKGRLDFNTLMKGDKT